MKKADFKKIVKETSPLEYMDYKEYLAHVYQLVKSKAASYSYIHFSRDVGLGDCNATLLIIQGKRPLTLKAGEKVAALLGLSGVQKKFFLALITYSHSKDPVKRAHAERQLLLLKSKELHHAGDKKFLTFFSQWYHAAILELLSIPRAKDDPKWISQQLMPKLTEAKVRASLQLLKELKLIRFSKQKGRLVPSKKDIDTGPEVFGMAITKHHEQMLDLARSAVHRVDPYERNISSLTVAASEEEIEEIKKDIEALQDKILRKLSDSKGSQKVMQVNFQLFPLSNTITKDPRG